MPGADYTAAPSATLEPLVSALEYRSEFNESDRAAVLALPHIVKLIEPQHYVVREFDRTTHAALLLSGLAIRHKIVGSGHRQIVAIHMRGDFVDLENSLLGIADHSVQMLTRGSIAMITREEIQRIAVERPALGQALWKQTLVEASVSREWIANVGRRDARTRIAHLLCEFAIRFKLAGLGECKDYGLPMTQEQLGDATGLTAVHVNRTIKWFEAQNLIKRLSPRSIAIADWKRLIDIGDFNTNYLHLRENELTLA